MLAAPVLADGPKKAQAVSDPKLRASINRAVDRAIENLKRIQLRSGEWRWGNRRIYGAGVTALALYALAASKVPAADETMVRGFEWTSKHASKYGPYGPFATYSASALALALARSDPERHAPRVRGIARTIANGQSSRGVWGYQLNRGGRGDNSNTQFAVMALWMAETHCGFKVPKKTWERIQRLYGGSQERDGGWNYGHGRGSSSDSMTAAGLFGYVVSKASLDGGVATLPAVRRKPVARKGLSRLLRSQSPNNLYFLYGLERAATLMDAPPREWYVENARSLVKSQQADGGWGRMDPYSTSLALLFLSRATRYVITPRPAAKTVTTAKFPNVVTVKNLKRAFEAYLLSRPAARATVRARFAGAGTASLALFVDRLADPEEVVRVAAHELLTALLDHPLLFDPKAPREDRKMMVHAVRTYFQSNRERLAWDADSARFVRR